MAKLIKSFCVDADDDRDLALFLEDLPHGTLSKVVRAALRAYIANEGHGVTLGDVYEAIKRVERKIDQGVTVADSGALDLGDCGSDPPGCEQAAANLAQWGV